NYLHRERRYSSMSRTIYLEDSKPDDIKAKLDKGVLQITVPKEEKAIKSVTIDVD
ncbi:MAG: Hsp20 family protein, partial [Dethiobacteria bacterium]